jgi:hypothetical protein
LLQLHHDIRRPLGRHFFVEQPRRPAAKKQRAPAYRESKTGELVVWVAVPRKPPHFRRLLLQWQILEMLWQRIPPSFKHQYPIAVGFIRVQKMLSEDTAETAAADDDSVERPGIVLGTVVRSLRILIRAVHGLVEAVAHVAAENVHGEIGKLSCLARRHIRTPTVNAFKMCSQG